MEDSLEDFIRIARNTKQSNESTSKANISSALEEHKQKCEKYAHSIVELLIEGKLKEIIYLKSLDFINPKLYQDIIEERAISKLCGYPLCGKKLEEVTKQQYKISKKNQSVYEITERKNFCSNFCYNASCHIKNQIDSSPLWVRKAEDKKTYNLLQEKHSGLAPGEAIELGVRKPKTFNFTPVSSFTEASLDEAVEIEQIPEFTNDSNDEDFGENVPEVVENFKRTPKKSILKKQSFDEIELGENNDSKKVSFNEIATETILESSVVEEKYPNTKEEEIFEDRIKPVPIDVEKMSKTIEKIHLSDKHKVRQPILIETTKNPEALVTKSKRTVELPQYSKRILEKINNSNVNPLKEQIVEKIKSQENSRKCGEEENEKMMKILAKLKSKQQNKKQGTILLNTNEIPINKIDENVKIINESKKEKFHIKSIKQTVFNWITLETFINIHGESKVKTILNMEKLSDYFDNLKIAEANIEQKLKYLEICKKVQLKELADEKFDKSLISKELKPVPDFASLKEQSKEMDLKVKAFYSGNLYEKEDANFPHVKQDDDENTAFLPLVDVTSQMVTRRTIFMNSITKFAEKHIKEMSVDTVDEHLMESIYELSRTFRLSADNIVLKPFQWDFVSLLLIFIVGKKNEALRKMLNEQAALLYFQLFTESYEDGKRLFEEILQTLDNVEEFVEMFIKELS